MSTLYNVGPSLSFSSVQENGTNHVNKYLNNNVNNNVMVSGGIYSNNDGNGLNIIHRPNRLLQQGGRDDGDDDDDGESTTSSSSTSSTNTTSTTTTTALTRIVVTDSTSIGHNRKNGIRIKQNDIVPGFFYYVFDSVSVHDNSWFGILLLNDIDGDDDDSGGNEKPRNEGTVESIIDLLIRNSYVTRNGHDGMLIVQHNTSITIEQSSFIQNGYFIDETKTTTSVDPISSSTGPDSASGVASVFSVTKSSPYGSGTSIYEPYSVVVSRSEFTDNLQNGLSIMDLQLQHMIDVADTSGVVGGGSSDGTASITNATRRAAVQLSYVKLFHNDRDGLVIIDSDPDPDDDQEESSINTAAAVAAPHVEMDNLIICSNKRNGMTLFHLKSLEINNGVISCRDLDGNGGWDYQLGGIKTNNIFSTTGPFATPRLIGDSCTNGIVGESPSTNFCSNDYLSPCRDRSCDSSLSSTTITNNNDFDDDDDDKFPTIGSSLPPPKLDESSINV